MKIKLFLVVFCFVASLGVSAQTVNVETFEVGANTYSWRYADSKRLITTSNYWFLNIFRDNGTGSTNGFDFSSYIGQIGGRYVGAATGHDTFGYLRSDTLAGGIDSISFKWQSLIPSSISGAKMKFLVRIVTPTDSVSLTDNNASLYSGETLNNDTVIYNLDQAQGSYKYAYPYGTAHHVFSCKNIKIAGKFVIKIYNLSYSYSSTGVINTGINQLLGIDSLTWKSTPSPSISYPATSPYVLGNEITLRPTVTGATPITYAINPDLNSATGLNFDSSTGIISGAPTKVYSGTFKVTATNSYASTSVAVNITTVVSAQTTTTETFEVGTNTYSWRYADTKRLITTSNNWFLNIFRDNGTGSGNGFDFSTYIGQIGGKYTGAATGANTYGYLRSDTLTGGIDSLAFRWQSLIPSTVNGAKSKFLVRIVTPTDSISLTDNNASLYSGETISNDTVIYNLDKTYGNYNYAYTYGSSHHIFSCKNINIKGKFVIKIYNISYSLNTDGTINTTVNQLLGIDSLTWKSSKYPSITYNASGAYNINTTINPLRPLLYGTAPMTFSITPDLTKTTGLTFDTSTGMISGTPTIVYSGTFNVTATNIWGNQTTSLTIAIHPEKKITGYVKTSTGNPVVSAVLSDGYSIFKTDVNGYYEFSANDSAKFVTITLPEQYAVPVDSVGHPILYGRLNAFGTTQHDFILTPFTSDELKADSTHVMIGIGDPQSFCDYTTNRYLTETMKDMKMLKESYPAGTHFYGVEIGDISWTDPNYLQPMYDASTGAGFPIFFTEGNHDQWASQDDYNRIYGPDHYSFDRGKIHYISFYNYLTSSNLTTNPYPNTSVINWIKKDLAEVPVDKAIVFLVHVPIEWDYGNISQTIYDLVSNRTTITHFISGHTHTIGNTIISNKLYDHTLPAAMGANWAGKTTYDGVPNGYGVFQAGNQGFNSWYYKGVNESRSTQFYAYPTGHINTGDNSTDSIVANVWNFDPSWSVNIYENGVKHAMTQYSGIDPDAYDFLGLSGDVHPDFPSANSGWTASRNPGYATTSKMFYYVPTNQNADFVVEATDRFGNIYTKPVLKHQMIASFDKADGLWQYIMDFDSLSLAYNPYLLSSGVSKGTWVQGHTPKGWYACTTGITLATSSSPAWADINYLNADNGDLASSGLYSYGAGISGVFGHNSGKRALGSLCDGNNRNVFYGVFLENNTGETITQLNISYTGEMWRAGTTPATAQTLEFSYATPDDDVVKSVRDKSSWIGQVNATVYSALSFSSSTTNTAAVNSLKNTSIIGTDAANYKNINSSISVNIAPGGVAMLRWKDKDDTNNDHALSICNLRVKASNDINAITAINESPVEFYVTNKTLHFIQNPGYTVEIIDIMGRLVYVKEITANSLDLSNILSNGVYIVHVGNSVKKVVL